MLFTVGRTLRSVLHRGLIYLPSTSSTQSAQFTPSTTTSRSTTTNLLPVRCYHLSPSLAKQGSQDDNTVSPLDLTQHRTAVSADDVIVFWHPKKPHPFAHSRAIDHSVRQKQPSKASEGEESRVLRAELDDLQRRRYLPKDGPTDGELNELFYTTKHEWYPKNRERRLRSTAQKEPKYRDGL